MAHMSPPIPDASGRLLTDDADFHRDWRIERNLVQARWGILVIWLLLIPFVATISAPVMLATAVMYGIGNVVLWRLVRDPLLTQRFSTVKRLATALEWASAIGALVVAAERLVVILPGGLLILVVLTGLRFRLPGVLAATVLASLVTVASFVWHAGVRHDVLRETADIAAVVWIVLFHVMGVLVGIIIRESDTARRRQASQWEFERLDAVRRVEEQRQADLAAYEQEQAHQEAQLADAAMRCDLALDELDAQKDTAVAEIVAELDAVRAELTGYRRQLNKLSEREETILRLRPRSELTYAEIGTHTYMTESSVKTYVHRIGIKFGLTERITRTAVVAAAYEQGILPGAEPRNPESLNDQGSSRSG